MNTTYKTLAILYLLMNTKEGKQGFIAHTQWKAVFRKAGIGYNTAHKYIHELIDKNILIPDATGYHVVSIKTALQLLLGSKGANVWVVRHGKTMMQLTYDIRKKIVLLKATSQVHASKGKIVEKHCIIRNQSKLIDRMHRDGVNVSMTGYRAMGKTLGMSASTGGKTLMLLHRSGQIELSPLRPQGNGVFTIKDINAEFRRAAKGYCPKKEARIKGIEHYRAVGWWQCQNYIVGVANPKKEYQEAKAKKGNFDFDSTFVPSLSDLLYSIHLQMYYV